MHLSEFEKSIRETATGSRSSTMVQTATILNLGNVNVSWTPYQPASPIALEQVILIKNLAWCNNEKTI